MSETAPKTMFVVLPPSHPFVKLTEKEFEDLWGPHVELVVSRPIPGGAP